ncbi:MAG: hypothetical protein HKN76_08780 [Saprospiraceae bacterium]|nr:hypothetical protein [Saprospiraceae bacterium]
MSDNKLDQFFKNKFDQAAPVEFNPSHWNEAKMLLKRKNDRTWLLLLLLVGFVTISGASYFFLQPRVTEPLEINESAVQEMADAEFISEPGAKINVAKDLLSTLAPEMDGSDFLKELPEQDVAQVASKKGSEEKAERDLRDVASNHLHVGTRELLEKNSGDDLGKMAEKKETQESNILTSSPPGTTTHSLRQQWHIPMLGGTAADDLDYHYAIGLRSSDLPISRERTNRKRYAWSGTLMLNPANTQGLTVQGLLVGFTYERYIRPNWFVGVRPSLQLQTNQNSFSKFEQVTTYSFSAVNTTYGLQADNLQFFSAPIYLALESGNHTLELGASLDLLLAARGKLQQVSIEDQAIATVENLGSGWIETGDMQRLSTNLFLGYKNAVSQRLKTGITFFYNPAKIYPGLPNNQPQINNARWYIGWQANYYIK